MGKETFTIRPYENSDVFAVVDMIAILAEGSCKELGGLFSSYSDAKDIKQNAEMSTAEKKRKSDECAEQLGLLIGQILGKCYKELKPMAVSWFASLCNKTEDEFMRLPPLTTLDLIKHLKKSKESKDFFSSAYQLFSEMNGSGIDTTGG